MPKKSAGLLLFREASGGLEVLLVHPGGPFWSRKDEGAWSIPKGEFDDGEDPLAAARREFEEETGFPAPGDAVALEPLQQSGGSWSLPGPCAETSIRTGSKATPLRSNGRPNPAESRISPRSIGPAGFRSSSPGARS